LFQKTHCGQALEIEWNRDETLGIERFNQEQVSNINTIYTVNVSIKKAICFDVL
jgi:hypothetical protein